LGPLRTKEAKGCVEKWMMQVWNLFLLILRVLVISFIDKKVEEMMRGAVHDVVDGCQESYINTPRMEWIQVFFKINKKYLNPLIIFENDFRTGLAKLFYLFH